MSSPNHRVAVRRYRKKYPERRRAEKRRWADKHRMDRTAKRHNTTVQRILTELKDQQSECAGCGQYYKEGRGLKLDHNHKTGEIRGMLCNICNLVLGLLKDNPWRLEKMARYLRGLKETWDDKGNLRRT